MNLTQLIEPISFSVSQPRRGEHTPLAIFVRNRLADLGLRQSEFCRLNGFDQGLMSRIQNSMITNLSVESVLRLALGLRTSPQEIFGLIGRMDLHELVVRSYSLDGDLLKNSSESYQESCDGGRAERMP